MDDSRGGSSSDRTFKDNFCQAMGSFHESMSTVRLA